jgi:hypothetical protein
MFSLDHVYGFVPKLTSLLEERVSNLRVKHTDINDTAQYQEPVLQP